MCINVPHVPPQPKQTSYTLRKVGGLEIVNLRARYAELNQIGLIGGARCGGYSTLQASSPALVGLKVHA